MSNYDPFRLYDYKQKKSHKGQVIRKKFVGHPLPTVLTPEQLKEAKDILEGIGYTVTKNPILPPPPAPPPETQYRSFIYCDKLTNYLLNAGDHIMHLSDVWNDKILDFQDLFVPSDRVNSFTFEINVIGYYFGGPLNTSGTGNGTVNLNLYNAVDYKYFEIKVPYSTYTRTGGVSYFPPNSNSVALIGAFNAANDTYDISLNGEMVREYTSPFLYHYFDNTVETYNAIVTSDFTDYNPILMQIGLGVPSAISGSTVTFSSIYITYQITMTINANI